MTDTTKDIPCTEFSIVRLSGAKDYMNVTLTLEASGIDVGVGSHLTGEAATMAFVSFVLTHAWAILRSKGDQWAVDKLAVDTLQRVVVTHAQTFISKVFGVEVKP